MGDREIGNAWYDSATRALRYVDLDSPDTTANLQLLDEVDGKLLFLAQDGNKMEIWEVETTTHRVGNRHVLARAPSGGSHRLSGVWNDGNQLLFEQTQTLGETTIVRRYRLTEEGMRLTLVRGDESLVTRFSASATPDMAWQNEIVPYAVDPITWTPESNAHATQYMGTLHNSGVDAWVALIGAENRVWIHRDTRKVVVPGMDEIPDDLQIVGVDNELHEDVALFYSASTRTVYRQEGSHFSWTDSQVETITNAAFNRTGTWTFSGGCRPVPTAHHGSAPGRCHGHPLCLAHL